MEYMQSIPPLPLSPARPLVRNWPHSSPSPPTLPLSLSLPGSFRLFAPLLAFTLSTRRRSQLTSRTFLERDTFTREVVGLAQSTFRSGSLSGGN